MEELKRKLLFRSKHRGFKEADIILGTFAEKFVCEMSDSELQEYDLILQQSDNDIYDWYTGKLEVPSDMSGSVMTKLLAHKVVG